MAGDANCKSVRQMLAPNMVMCRDKNGTETGYRLAMSKTSMHGYYQQKAQNASDRAKFLQAMNGIATTLTETGASMRNSAATIPNVQVPGPSARTGQIEWPANNAATSPPNSPDLNKWVPSSGVVPTAPTAVIVGNCLGTFSQGSCIGVFDTTNGGQYICNGPIVLDKCLGKLTLAKP